MTKQKRDALLVHTAVMPIRWGDMDAMGHVNNAVYFRYLEQARVDWLTSFGYPPNTGREEGVVIVNAHCSFLKQLRYPGDIEVRTFVGVIGRSSVETVQEIRRSDAPDVLCAEGGAKMVWVNYSREKSVPLPDHIRQLLTQGKPFAL